MAHPQPRDMADTERRILGWLEGNVPGSDFRVTNLSMPSNTGFSSDTLLFDLDWKENGAARHESLVMRLTPPGFRVFPNYDLSVQYRILRALAPTDVPVPEVLWHEDDLGAMNSPFYLMRRVDGWVPSDNPPMHTAGRIFEMTPAEREAVWWSGLETMARIHRLDWRALGLDFLADPERGRTPIEQQLNYYEEYFDWGLPGRSRYPIIQAALDYLRRNQPAEEPLGFSWGDSRISNMIFRGTECVAVLDWEMARLGNPVQDVAWWNILDLCFTEGLNIPRLEGLPSHEATVARWAELTGHSTEHLKYYEILGLLRFSAIMARIGLQMKHYEILPADDPFDVDNLASVTLARRLVRAGL
jgi:aminoglycoside phosphotransferase (APT) family kinase protein